jgi:hypothetical protein
MVLDHVAGNVWSVSGQQQRELRWSNPNHINGETLAKPNYQYEKRQRDLAKKKKKEEKRQRKLDKNQTQADENGDQAAEGPGSD